MGFLHQNQYQLQAASRSPEMTTTLYVVAMARVVAVAHLCNNSASLPGNETRINLMGALWREPKGRWIVQTESNVKREMRKRPVPPCTVCNGTGCVSCRRCRGRGICQRSQKDIRLYNLTMQDPFVASDHSSYKPKAKPQRKQVALLQPKTPSVLGSTPQAGKAVISNVAKTTKKGAKGTKQANVFEAKKNISSSTASPPARPVVDMMVVTEGDSRTLYRALKHKYLILEEESFRLAEELEKTEDEVKELEAEKMALLDELLVLEGFAFNPYALVPPYPKNPVNLRPPRQL